MVHDTASQACNCINGSRLRKCSMHHRPSRQQGPLNPTHLSSCLLSLALASPTAVWWHACGFQMRPANSQASDKDAVSLQHQRARRQYAWNRCRCCPTASPQLHQPSHQMGLCKSLQAAFACFRCRRTPKKSPNEWNRDRSSTTPRLLSNAILGSQLVLKLLHLRSRRVG